MSTKQIGKLLAGRYRIDELLGSGGMGEVYRAYDMTMDREVAIKLVRNDGTVDEKQFRRMQNEAKALAALDHPNIVKVQAVNFGGVDGYLGLIAMELVCGETLQEKVKGDGPLKAEDAEKICAAIADALAHAHSKGVVHRDLKPHNIIVTTGGGIRIMDFGIAKLIGVQDQRLTRTGEVVGSPQYMSPEQCSNQSIDQRSDIYSLGALMYFLLTGSPPFDGATVLEVLMKHSSEAPNLEAITDQRIKAIIAKCLAKNPDDRFQFAQEVSDCLRNKSAAPLLIPQRSQSSARIRPRISLQVSIGLAAILAILLVTSFVTTRTTNAPQSEKADFDLKHLQKITEKIQRQNFAAEDVQQLEAMRDQIIARKDNDLTNDYESILLYAYQQQGSTKTSEQYDRVISSYQALGEYPEYWVIDYFDFLARNGLVERAERTSEQWCTMLANRKSVDPQINAFYTRLTRILLGGVLARCHQTQKLNDLSESLSKNAEAYDAEIFSRFEYQHQSNPALQIRFSQPYLSLPYTHKLPGFRAIALWIAAEETAGNPRVALDNCQSGLKEAEGGLKDTQVSALQRQRCKEQKAKLSALQSELKKRIKKLEQSES